MTDEVQHAVGQSPSTAHIPVSRQAASTANGINEIQMQQLPNGLEYDVPLPPTPKTLSETGSKEKVKKRSFAYPELEDFFLHLTLSRSFLRPRRLSVRVVSIAITLLLVAATLYLISVLCVEYNSRPNTTYSIEQTRNRTMLLPTITLCTNARVNITKIYQMGIDNDVLSYMMAAFGGYRFHLHDVMSASDARFSAVEQQYRTLMETFQTAYRFFMQMGFDCETFIATCMFQGIRFDCCQGVRSFLSEKGKCFELTKLPFGGYQQFPGEASALYILLRNWESQYPEVFINGNPENGVEVWLTLPENVGLAEKTVAVGPGQKVSLELSLSKWQRLSEPLGSCDSELTSKTYPSYTIKGCYKECMGRLVRLQCGCTPIGMLAPSEADEKGVCEPSTAVNCVNRVLHTVNNTIFELYDLDIECNCSKPCVENNLEASATYGGLGAFPYQSARSLVEENTDSKDEILLEIFYSKFSYKTLVETTPVSITALLRDIAVVIVVLLGIHVLAVFQFLLHIVKFVFRKVCAC